VFRELDMDCTYIAYRIQKGELEEGIESLKKINIAGFNVTIPHKVEMMKYLDKVDEDCSIIGAVNTVKFTDGVLKGYNTDMDGFLEPIRMRNLPINDSKVLLLGAGGAARAIVAAFAKEKSQKITIANRTIQKANELVEFANKIGIDAKAVTLEQAGNEVSKHDFIVNATSIGLKNESSPISLDSISKDSIAYDIVYMPINTDFLKKSKEKGATIIYGYEMLLGQASRAFEIWHEKAAPYEVMKRSILGGF
jgi:shikimate dehydrogenase